MAIVSCTACQKKLKVADTSLGKKVKCSCGHIFVAEAEVAFAAASPVMAAEAPDKVIVACTECGSKVKVATTSLGKKLKCPKCGAVFVADSASPSPPVTAAPVVASVVVAEPVEDDDFIAFKSTPRSGKAPPPIEDDDEDAPPAPQSKSKHDPKRPVPADTDAPKKYPSRILVNCFVFFMLFAFLAFFAGVFLFMDEENLLDPTSALEPTNRKLLESFGWPEKVPLAIKPAPVAPPAPNKDADINTTKPIETIKEKLDPDKGADKGNGADKDKKGDDGKNKAPDKPDENACSDRQPLTWPEVVQGAARQSLAEVRSQAELGNEIEKRWNY